MKGFVGRGKGVGGNGVVERTQLSTIEGNRGGEEGCATNRSLEIEGLSDGFGGVGGFQSWVMIRKRR